MSAFFVNLKCKVNISTKIKCQIHVSSKLKCPFINLFNPLKSTKTQVKKSGFSL